MDQSWASLVSINNCESFTGDPYDYRFLNSREFTVALKKSALLAEDGSYLLAADGTKILLL